MRIPAVDFKLFAIDATQGSASSLEVMLGDDPNKLKELYRKAGLDLVADNADVWHRSSKALERFPEVVSDDYYLYTQFLDSYSKLQDFSTPPHPQIVAELAVANQTRYFDHLEVISSSKTGEALAFGVIKLPNGTQQRFAVAQWGQKLHTIEEFREQFKKRTPNWLQRNITEPWLLIPLIMLGGMSIAWLLVLVSIWIALPVAVVSTGVLMRMLYEAELDQELHPALILAYGLMLLGNGIGLIAFCLR
jgi:hypothetical protein